MATGALSGLVVVVPEAEPVVGPLRATLDESAPLGAPAHVTVLFPFVPAAELDDAVLSRLDRLFGAVAPFGYRFSRTDWFGDDVVWLAPDDPVPFQQLTRRVWVEFPQHPPFEGTFGEDVVPHLTVGHRHPRPVLASAERAVSAGLPVAEAATEVTLLAQQEPRGRWTRRASFPLGS